jgi:hypothetical protein
MKQHARDVLCAANITAGQDFDSLDTHQRAAISREASAVYQTKHGKPMPDDSARYIRKRYDLLQHRAAS